ncbi:hypothetical protein Scep_026577 [Stephania cephalantha]|uniref:Uncharacterized protein n=1 Tax=Stephania cephalantha TaxID=152367 RepID=A0AAP0ESN8_9MAGN
MTTTQQHGKQQQQWQTADSSKNSMIGDKANKTTAKLAMKLAKQGLYLNECKQQQLERNSRERSSQRSGSSASEWQLVARQWCRQRRGDDGGATSTSAR